MCILLYSRILRYDSFMYCYVTECIVSFFQKQMWSVYFYTLHVDFNVDLYFVMWLPLISHVKQIHDCEVM